MHPKKLSFLYFLFSWFGLGPVRIGVFGRERVLGLVVLDVSCSPGCLVLMNAALIYLFGVVRVSFPILHMLWSADLSHALHQPWL